MNHRYDTSMLPQADLLRVCLSCWRRVPSFFIRQIHHHRFPASTQLTCNGACGTRWRSALAINTRQFSSSSKAEETDITKNPFYEKYQQKLKHMKEENPERFEAGVAKLEESKNELQKRLQNPTPETSEPLQKPDIPGYRTPKSWPPKSLDEIMKLELVKDLDNKAITHIWQEYHLSRECIFSVVPAKDYDEIVTKSKLNPSFLFTLPKGDGYEFYLSQFNGKDVYFTPLGIYQLVKESAPPCLTVAHFPELKEDKGIVLMAGEYDDKVLKKEEALNLVKQMTLYYGKDAEDRYKILRTFNSAPEQFDYMSVVEQYKQNREYLEQNPY